MKYWHIYYHRNEQRYVIKQMESPDYIDQYTIAVFRVFDMAYAYINHLNGTNLNNPYSRWATYAR